jgi:hypothetical protein
MTILLAIGAKCVHGKGEIDTNTWQSDWKKNHMARVNAIKQKDKNRNVGTAIRTTDCVQLFSI